MHYDSEKKRLVVNYSSTLLPSEPYAVDLETGAMKSLEASTVPFDPSKFAVDKISYISKDGTDVPMYVVRAKDGYDMDGNNETLVDGYGGFEFDNADQSFLPSDVIPFLEAGGTIAFPGASRRCGVGRSLARRRHAGKEAKRL